MSPETDLIDQLMGDDESLNFALIIFGGVNNPEALDKARYSVIQQLHEGLVEVKQKNINFERILPDWEAKQILAADEHWLGNGQEAEYYLSLTQKGAKLLS
jgi:hypothetical protein